MPARSLLQVLGSVVLLSACTSTPPPRSVATKAPAPRSDYVTIIPDESTYPARTPSKPPEPVGEHEDVMASILAIPPGR
jgi:hypothetical protein